MNAKVELDKAGQFGQKSNMNPWKTLSDDGQTITIKRFNGQFAIPEFVTPQWREENHAQIAVAAVVDTETTGLDYKSCRVIEIAIQTVRFHKTLGCLVAVEKSYTGLQDPGFPLAAETTEITGLTDADLKGRNIDWAQVKFLLDHSELIIAHNAGFDRPFIEGELGEKIEKIWACSWKQIDWAAKGYDIKQLGLLSAYHGFFVDAHRAMNDVNALVHLLSHTDATTGKGYFAELQLNAIRPQTKIIAAGAPFETKDLLKAQGYRWDNQGRAWNRVLYSDLLPQEIEWLEDEVYQGKFGGKLVEIPVVERFQAE